MAGQEKRTVLIAGIGTSPAVLTETVWALAHQKEAVVPEEVVVITTKTGKARLWAELVDGGVWKGLVASLAREQVPGSEQLHLGTTAIRVLPDAEGNEIDDLRTAEDNLRAADFMLGVVRQYTADPSTRVLASIAGGRKTMSALLFSCMSLLGRSDDRIFHVLTMPEALALKPPFYFPRKGKMHECFENGKSRKISAQHVAVELFEVPFVPIRGWFKEKCDDLPPTYTALVKQLRTGGPQAIAYPEIELDYEGQGTVRILPMQTDVRLSAVEFVLLGVIASGAPKEDWSARLLALKKRMEPLSFPMKVKWNDTFVESPRFRGGKDDPLGMGDLADCLSEIRRKLRRAGFPESETLAPKRNAAVTFPLGNFKPVHAEVLPAEIRRCLCPAPAGKEMVDCAP